MVIISEAIIPQAPVLQETSSLCQNNKKRRNCSSWYCLRDRSWGSGKEADIAGVLKEGQKVSTKKTMHWTCFGVRNSMGFILGWNLDHPGLCCSSVSTSCEGGAWVPAGACGACKGQAVLLTKARAGGNSGYFPVWSLERLKLLSAVVREHWGCLKKEREV